MKISDPKHLESLIAKGLIPANMVDDARKAVKAPAKSSKSKGRSLPIEFSTLPPAMPAAALYHALCHRLGRYFEGGEVAWEMELTFTERKYRYDIALPRYTTMIELDGFSSHGLSLDGFKRDRDKQLVLAKHGWLMLRISSSQVTQELDSSIMAILQAITYRTYIPNVNVTLTRFDACQCNDNPAIPAAIKKPPNIYV